MAAPRSRPEVFLSSVRQQHPLGSSLPFFWKFLGSLLSQAPLLTSLLLFFWSMTVFRHSFHLFTGSPKNCVPETFPLSSSLLLDSSGKDLAHGSHLSLQIPSHLISEEKNPFFLSSMKRPRVLLGKKETAKIADVAVSDSVPSLTIFCAPKPYGNGTDGSQRRALLSWLALKPVPKIVLLGDDPSFKEIEEEFKDFVSVDSHVDYNFNGIPQFHSIVARAQAAETDLSMIINGDIILLNDLFPSIKKVGAAFDNWVLTAPRWDLGESFPFSFEKDSLRKSLKTQSEMEDEIREFAKSEGSLHTYGGVDFWLWNNSPVPLFSDSMPPFTFGRSKYDNWFTHEIIASGFRAVVDAGDALTNCHVAHSYSHVRTDAAGGGVGGGGSVEAGKNFWSARKKSSWEMFNNIHLAESHGSYTNQKGTALHATWRLASCHEPAADNICLLKRARPGNCSCEYSPYITNTQSDPKLDQKGRWTCGSVSVDRSKDYSILATTSPDSKPGLPHTMDQLLPKQALLVGDLKVVTLVAVTIGYAEMLMNFICRLRLMGLDKNLVVAALDEDLYKFAFTQGLPVYYEHAGDGLKSIDSANCAFGTPCFRQFTKLKSRAVLRVLQAGYSVLWTDVDIVWYTDPLPHLMEYGPGTFPVQSNEPNASIPGTGIRRINSGFYFARSDEQTIEAFSAIVEHAKKTKLSEQPSFYDILCGEKGELLVRGKEECRWKNGLRTIFLDRAMYPNGAVHGFWDETDVTGACKDKGCAILHNNWISGKDAKKGRLVQNGYWHYDVERRMCMYNWHDKLHPVQKLKKESSNSEAERK